MTGEVASSSPPAVADEVPIVFVSYKREEDALTDAVEKALQARGYLTLTDRNIGSGEVYPLAIDRMILRSSLALVLWTRASVQSEWVLAEATRAHSLERESKRTRYLGVLIDPVGDALPLPLNTRQCVDLTELSGRADRVPDAPALARVVRAVEALVPLPAKLTAETARRRSDDAQRELAVYVDAVRADSDAALKVYLGEYSEGTYAAEARQRLRQRSSKVHGWLRSWANVPAALGLAGLLLAAWPILRESGLFMGGTDAGTEATAPADTDAKLASDAVAGAAPAVAPASVLAPASGTAADDAPAAAPPEFAPDSAVAAAEPALPVPPPVSSSAPADDNTEVSWLYWPAEDQPVKRSDAAVLPEAAVADSRLPLVEADLTAEVFACDLAAGSPGYASELAALGRPVVNPDQIDGSVAIPACEAANRAHPGHARTMHLYALALSAKGPEDKDNWERAVALHAQNCEQSGRAGAPSCHNLGNHYRDGKIGGKSDPEKAAQLYGQACQGGNAPACNDLGLLYGDGRIGDAPDYKKAVEAYRQACDQDHARGCRNAAWTLRNRIEPKDLALAEAMARKACELAPQDGSGKGCNDLGDMYYHGEIGGVADYAGAKAAFTLACDQDYALGCSNAAWTLRNRIEPKDLALTEAMARKACDLAPQDGSGQGCNTLGAMYANGEIGGVSDYVKAVDAYTLSCDQDYAFGCSNAAWALLNRVEPKDRALAEAMARKACDLAPQDGSGEGCDTLGAMYANGEIGGVVDYIEADKNYRLACDQDFAFGCSNAASILHDRDEVKNLKLAEAMAIKACELASQDGRNYGCGILASMFHESEISELADREAAWAVLEKSCDLDVALSCSWLGYLLAYGVDFASEKAEEARAHHIRACALSADYCDQLANFYLKAPQGKYPANEVAPILLKVLGNGYKPLADDLIAGVADGPVMAEVQKLLAEKGFAVGTPDGKTGPNTIAAIKSLCACGL